MLRLAACSAVLTGDVPSCLDDDRWLQRCEPVDPDKAVSSAAAYALAAVERLQIPATARPALFTFSGPSGSTIHFFDRALRESVDGRLMGPDFPRRARRIHPFTLLLSLHNQVAATLSLELGFNGPTLNLVDSPASFVDLIPNMALEVDHRPVLAVLSSAANRAEERTRLVAATGCSSGIEGAIALLFTPDGQLAEIAPAVSGDPAAAAGGVVTGVGPGIAVPGGGQQWPFGPCLEAGLAALWALTTGARAVCFQVGTPARKATFSWKAL